MPAIVFLFAGTKIFCPGTRMARSYRCSNISFADKQKTTTFRMKILFLTHSFNSLAQRLYIELTRRGHTVSIEFDINDAVTAQAVELYRPDLIVAPVFKRAIPETVWGNHVCFVVHPGLVGDRGPSALDWAIMRDCAEWGITVLQANGEMDGGDIWAAETFPMRLAKKSSLYRNEVLEAAARAVQA